MSICVDLAWAFCTAVSPKMFQIFTLSTLLLMATTHASRYYCYKGSSLYQVEYVDCGNLNSGDWYCSKITVCENDIDSERDCIETRYEIIE